MKKNKLKLALIFNVIIILMNVFASVAMFCGFKFMSGYDLVLASNKLGMFRFFTVQSNLFMGIVALIFAIKEYKYLKDDKEISLSSYVLKMVATVSVALTFVVVFAYLGPVVKGGLAALLMNSNLFFHLFIPVFSVITFIFLENDKKIDYKYTIYGLVPTFLYEIYYLSNILVHMENNSVSPVYDWYYFVQNGVSSALIIAPIMLVVTYIITVVIWFANKKTK
ncbi:MAG: hypothetical protein E7159_02460 [Firmicutes bacterium]|nr:hypothetical protein [Bacillota bacterium]